MSGMKLRMIAPTAPGAPRCPTKKNALQIVTVNRETAATASHAPSRARPPLVAVDQHAGEQAQGGHVETERCVEDRREELLTDLDSDKSGAPGDTQ